MIGTLMFLDRGKLGDFGNYFYGSKYLENGTFGERTYDPFAFNDDLGGHHETALYLNYTPVPPFTAVFFVPLFVGFQLAHTAKIVWLIASGLLFIFSLLRLFRHLQINLEWLAVVPLVFLLPIKSNIDQGQLYFLIFALIAEGWIAFEKKRTWLAAVLWGLAIVLKVLPLVILLFLLFRREWKTFFATLGAVLVLMAVSLIWIDVSIWKLYLFDILPRISDGQINDPYAYTYQSVQVLLRRLFVPDDQLNPRLVVDAPWAYTVSYTIIRAGFLFAAASFTAAPQRAFQSFVMWLLVAMLVSGYGSSYALILLIFFFAAIIRSEISEAKSSLLIVLLAVACLIPAQLLAGLPLALQFPRLYFLAALFITALFFWEKFMVTRWSLLLTAGVMTITISFPHEEKSHYLPRERHELMNGRMTFDEKSHSFTVACIGEYGQYPDSIPAPAPGTKVTACTFTRHEIDCRGKKILFPREWVRDAYILTEGKKETLWYLSDHGRGVGFYAVRALSLNEEPKKDVLP